MRQNVEYAVVMGDGDDTLRRFPHHNTSEGGHTHESVDMRELHESLLRARNEAKTTPTRILEAGIRHLEHHAEALGFSVLTDRQDLSVEESSILDMIDKIYADFEAAYGNLTWWDRPWIVDILDGSVIARHNDCRYYRHPYTMEDGKCVFVDDDKVEVKRVWEDATDDDASEDDEPPQMLEAQVLTSDGMEEAVTKALTAFFDDEESLEEAKKRKKKKNMYEGQEGDDGAETTPAAESGDPADEGDPANEGGDDGASTDE